LGLRRRWITKKVLRSSRLFDTHIPNHGIHYYNVSQDSTPLLLKIMTSCPVYLRTTCSTFEQVLIKNADFVKVPVRVKPVRSTMAWDSFPALFRRKNVDFGTIV
jgi:hypothetical protein